MLVHASACSELLCRITLVRRIMGDDEQKQQSLGKTGVQTEVRLSKVATVSILRT